MTPLYPPAAFGVPPGVAHLCAGGEPPFLESHARAFALYARHKSAGYAGRDAQGEEILRVRRLLAEDWGAPVEEIGFVSSVAEGVSMLAESMDLAGGNVVAADIEYPSMIGPFARLPGVELRLAEGLGGIAQMVDANTRVILASDISNLTGEAADLEGLRLLADRVGAALVVDHTQAAGWKRIRVGIADFAFSACYKWLLGTTGIAVAHWNRARQPDWAPSTQGWFSVATPTDWSAPRLKPDAMRFCRGNPAFLPLYVLGNALDFARGYDPAQVEAHVHKLSADLRQGMIAAGITPTTPANHGANVCMAHPESDAVVAAMAEDGVMAWGGRGRLRFSLHAYNGSADVAQALDALQKALAKV